MIMEDLDELDSCAVISSPENTATNFFSPDEYLEICGSIPSPKAVSENRDAVSVWSPSSKVRDVNAPVEYTPGVVKMYVSPKSTKTQETQTINQMTQASQTTIQLTKVERPVLRKKNGSVGKLAQIYEQRPIEYEPPSPVKKVIIKSPPPQGGVAQNFMEFQTAQRLRDEEFRRRREIDRQRLHSNDLATALHEANVQAHFNVSRENFSQVAKDASRFRRGSSAASEKQLTFFQHPSFQSDVTEDDDRADDPPPSLQEDELKEQDTVPQHEEPAPVVTESATQHDEEPAPVVTESATQHEEDPAPVAATVTECDYEDTDPLVVFATSETSSMAHAGLFLGIVSLLAVLLRSLAESLHTSPDGLPPPTSPWPLG